MTIPRGRDRAALAFPLCPGLHICQIFLYIPKHEAQCFERWWYFISRNVAPKWCYFSPVLEGRACWKRQSNSNFGRPIAWVIEFSVRFGESWGNTIPFMMEAKPVDVLKFQENKIRICNQAVKTKKEEEEKDQCGSSILLNLNPQL